MERLTRRLADGRACFKPHLYGHTNKEVCDRLAAYEETGLEPEEIRNQLESMLDAVALYFETTPDRLRELAQADREGRIEIIEPDVMECIKIVRKAEAALRGGAVWLNTSQKRKP